jgi:nicotinamide riboside kinase
MTPGTGLRIAIVGAESTGKTVLAQALARRLASLTGWRCTWVPEWLRQWCDAHGRTPRADEQRAIAERQQALIDQAAAQHDLVVCDTTPLMTAVYSQLLFADHTLEAYAVAQQRRCQLTLLTALDIPWVADGLQRDGPQVRLPVDDAVRQLLTVHGLPWAVVSGSGEARLDAAVAAVAAVAPWLAQNERFMPSV